MSERPEADKAGTSSAGPGVVSTTSPEPHATTVAKPGVGKQPDNRPPPPSQKSGEATYPDGYRMITNPDGTILLQNPGKVYAEWSNDLQAWINHDTGEPYPNDWSAGHYPGTQGIDGKGSQGTTPAHPNQP